MRTALALLLLGTLALGQVALLVCPMQGAHHDEGAQTDGHDMMVMTESGDDVHSSPHETGHDGCALVMTCGTTAVVSTSSVVPTGRSAVVRPHVGSSRVGPSGTIDLESPPPRRA